MAKGEDAGGKASVQDEGEDERHLLSKEDAALLDRLLHGEDDAESDVDQQQQHNKKQASNSDGGASASGADRGPTPFVGRSSRRLLSGADREMLFARGQELADKGARSTALRCFHACLRDLRPDIEFTSLPACLNKIAEVYSELGDFDRAVYFLQAEKMFYENALTDMAALAKRVEAAPGEGARQSGAEAGEDGKAREQKDKDKDGDAATSEPTKPELRRAEELDGLARLCLERYRDTRSDSPQRAQRQLELAIEYAGKAYKLRQRVYREDDPRLTDRLDLLAELYAETGRASYAAALKKHEANPTDEEAVKAALAVPRQGFSCCFLAMLAIVLMPVFSALLFWGFCHFRPRQCPPWRLVRRDIELFVGAAINCVVEGAELLYLAAKHRYDMFVHGPPPG